MPSLLKRNAPVVYVANRVPWPLDDGWKRRTFAVLQGIAATTDVVVVAPDPNDSALVREFQEALGPRVTSRLATSTAPIAPLRAMVASVRTGRSPLSTRHFTTALAAEVIRSVESSGATLVVYAGAFLAETHASTPQLRNIPFVVDTHNIDSHAMMRRVHSSVSVSGAVTTVVSRMLRVAEARVFTQAAAVLVCSEPEVALVKALAGDARVHVVPNGVDTNVFTLHAPRPRDGVVRLLFFGQLDYPPNVDAMRYFASDIFPAFQSTGVPFHVTIVGSGQGIAVREILQGLTGVEIVGRVPDVTQAIVAADAVIVPLRAGGGTRLKILEAMATGRLVVSTSVGSEGIEAKHDVHLWTANTPTDFAAALTALARDPAPMFAIARAGADFVRGTYSWSAIQERLRGVISTSPIEPPLHEQASVASASTAGSIASVP